MSEAYAKLTVEMTRASEAMRRLGAEVRRLMSTSTGKYHGRSGHANCVFRGPIWRGDTNEENFVACGKEIRGDRDYRYCRRHAGVVAQRDGAHPARFMGPEFHGIGRLRRFVSPTEKVKGRKKKA